MRKTIKIEGVDAFWIKEANLTSFYGIFGDGSQCYAGQRDANRLVREWLDENMIDWNSFLVLSTKNIDTSGTKVPYAAWITFEWD